MHSRLLAALVFLFCACDGGGDDDPVFDAAVHDASIDAVTACVGSAPITCEVVVDSEDQCPSFEAVCEGVCGDSHECCYCAPEAPGEAPAWQILYSDCEPCTPDGGVDAAE